MGKYLASLNATNEERLLKVLNFITIDNDDTINKGNEKFTNDSGYTIYHSFDYSHQNSNNDFDDYMILNDYEVKNNADRTDALRTFFGKMYGLQYQFDLFNYIKKNYHNTINPNDDIPTV